MEAERREFPSSVRGESNEEEEEEEEEEEKEENKEEVKMEEEEEKKKKLTRRIVKRRVSTSRNIHALVKLNTSDLASLEAFEAI
ncbi:hypothetical protein V1477_004062 [Vespula maculifrons]|uniref:Uncharacterized protein n=1 Tax=Vespula maculifrons TaxID=7453 RepID=A0ABD2CRS9_VESMC